MSHQDPPSTRVPTASSSAVGGCPGCQGSRSRPLGTKDGYPLQLCVSCRTIYTETRPLEQSINDMYDNYYDHASFELHPVVAGSLDRLARSLAPFRRTNCWLDVGYG